MVKARRQRGSVALGSGPFNWVGRVRNVVALNLIALRIRHDQFHFVGNGRRVWRDGDRTAVKMTGGYRAGFFTNPIGHLSHACRIHLHHQCRQKVVCQHRLFDPRKRCQLLGVF